MILLCPYCGHSLKTPFTCGISSCENCKRVFDSSDYFLLLSTSWLVRKRKLDSPEYLVERCNLSEDDAAFVISQVYDECVTHEEFIVNLEKRLFKK